MTPNQQPGDRLLHLGREEPKDKWRLDFRGRERDVFRLGAAGGQAPLTVMPKLIRAGDNRNAPLVTPGTDVLTLSYFNLVRLDAGQAVTLEVPGCETLAVVLSGRADVAAGAQEFKNVGRRADIWDGPADSVYCGTCPRLTIRALRDGTEVAVAGGACDQPFAPFRIPPEEVEMVEVGSAGTHSRRRIFHILGQNGAGRAGRLLVSELYGDDGCWSGYPPHKHDTERPPEETDFEEIYHYRYRPESGFGAQFCYDEDGREPVVTMTRHGDTFLIDRGYHPTVRAPGHEGYIFTILVGRRQRSLVQYFEPVHRPIVAKIPGIQAMRDKFK
jgi:5-deoxy-glucuronate isomerase